MQQGAERDAPGEAQARAREAEGLAPEQRDQRIQAEVLRALLSRAGIRDPRIYEALQDFLNERARSRRALRATATLVFLAGERLGMALSDAQFEALVVRYEHEAKAQREAEARAQEELDAKIHWRVQPRLRAVLLWNGIIGDAAWLSREELTIPGAADLEIVQFWTANRALPPGIEAP